MAKSVKGQMWQPSFADDGRKLLGHLDGIHWPSVWLSEHIFGVLLDGTDLELLCQLLASDGMKQINRLR